MVRFSFQHPKGLNSLTEFTKPMHEDSALNYIVIFEDDRPSHTLHKPQNQMVAPCTPPPEDHHEVKHFHCTLPIKNHKPLNFLKNNPYDQIIIHHKSRTK